MVHCLKFALTFHHNDKITILHADIATLSLIDRQIDGRVELSLGVNPA